MCVLVQPMPPLCRLPPQHLLFPSAQYGTCSQRPWDTAADPAGQRQSLERHLTCSGVEAGHAQTPRPRKRAQRTRIVRHGIPKQKPGRSNVA